MIERVKKKHKVHSLVKDLLDLIVQDEDEGTTQTSKNVRESSLEESRSTFVSGDLLPAIESTVVDLFATRLHHESSSDGIEGVRDDTRDGRHSLSDEELEEEASARVFADEQVLGGIVETEVSTSVHDDTLDGDTETLVEGHGTTLLGDLAQAVTETVELSLAIGTTDISSQSSSGKIEGVDDEQRTGTGKTTRSDVDTESLEELLLDVGLGEQLLDVVLEGEVESLSGEVSDDVSHVTSPQTADTLLLGDSSEAVDDTGVSGDLSVHDSRVGILSLDEKLDSLDGSDGGLGDGGGDTSGKPILTKGDKSIG